MADEPITTDTAPLSLDQQAQQSGGITSASVEVSGATPQEGVPYATIGDQTFANAEELRTWYDAQTTGEQTTEGGQDTAASTEGGTEAGSTEGDLPKGDKPEDALTDDQIKAHLVEAGGIYADERYLPFAIEFEKSGGKGLSPESLTKAAEAFGVPPEFIETFIAGEVSKKELAAVRASTPDPKVVAVGQAVGSIVSDAKEYAAILEWGAENLTAEQRASYDKAIDAGDTGTVKTLLESFQARFKADPLANPPRDITRGATGEGGSSTGVTGYASMREQQVDQQDPRYDKDPTFRKMVEGRIAASNF